MMNPEKHRQTETDRHKKKTKRRAKIERQVMMNTEKHRQIDRQTDRQTKMIDGKHGRHTDT